MNQIHHNLSEPTHLVMAVRVGCMYTQSVYFNCLYSRKLLAIFKTIITKKSDICAHPQIHMYIILFFCSLPLSKMSIYECMILECGIFYVLVYKRCQKKCWARFQYAQFFFYHKKIIIFFESLFNFSVDRLHKSTSTT